MPLRANGLVATSLMAVIVSSLALTYPAISGNYDKLPDGQVCWPRDASLPRTVDPKRLLIWIMSKYKISTAAQDYDDDGETTHTERVLALLDPMHCQPVPKTSERKLFCSSDDFGNLQKGREDLLNFLRKGNKKYIIKASHNLEKVQLLYPNEILSKPLSGVDDIELHGEEVEAYYFLVGAPRSKIVSCEKLTDVASPAGVAKKKKATIGKRIAGGSFVLRQNVDQFRLPLNASTFKKIKPAQVSVNRNIEDDTTEYNVKAVVGYRVPNLFTDRSTYTFDLIPYVGMERRFASGKDSNEVQNVTVGFDNHILWTPKDESLGSHTFDVYPQFLVDTEGDTKIGSLNLIWSPAWLTQMGLIPNFSWRWGNVGALIGSADVRLRGGYVFDDGGKVKLKDDETFIRVGTKLGVRLVFHSNSFIDRFIPYVNYKYLYGAKGELSRTDRMEAGLDFIFPKQKNVTLGAKYAEGEADETFEDIEFFEVTLGIRF